MATTTFLEGSGTRTWGGHQAVRCSDELLARYQALMDEKRLSWTEHHQLLRLLGRAARAWCTSASGAAPTSSPCRWP